MTKRPPEMVELVRAKVVSATGKARDGCVFPEFEPGEVVDADAALAAIRSLRVKLFRERAKYHTEAKYKYMTIVDAWGASMSEFQLGAYRLQCFHTKAATRFSRIADAIERGER